MHFGGKIWEIAIFHTEILICIVLKICFFSVNIYPSNIFKSLKICSKDGISRSYFMCACERIKIYMCKQELVTDFHQILSSRQNCLFKIMFVYSSSATDAKQYKFLQTQLTSNFISMLMFWQFKYVTENVSWLQALHCFEWLCSTCSWLILTQDLHSVRIKIYGVHILIGNWMFWGTLLV